ncbi:MAG: hypothetical protein JW900_15805 [Anaerolineae bacterium]|nr:hypothetical protein [Anaerolineae bacterium]
MGKIKLLLIVALLSAWWLRGPPVAQAQEPPPQDAFVVYDLRQGDLNQDGSPDVTIISASFATDQDRILVYDGADDMALSGEWAEATDFDDDVWIFDYGANGTANLIVFFSTAGDQYIAELYLDRDGDRQVSYVVRGSAVEIRESPFWTAQVVADGAWYNDDGSVNRNITVSVDGPTGERGLDHGYMRELEINDGIVDLELECHTGLEGDVQAYCLTRLFIPFKGGDIGRTKIRAAMAGYPLPEIVGYVFWPHLGLGLSGPRGPFEIAPALQVDWLAARFDPHSGINNVVQKEGPEQGWWLYSSHAVVKQRLNSIDFENPFAHYDLAQDRDGAAELVIRHVYDPPGTIWYQIGDHYAPTHDPRMTSEIVRYTWDQDNDGYWDYKVGLMGRGLVESVVSFPDFDIISIPYEQLPWEVTEEREWAGATFVQVEGQAESSPEGVYDWDEIYIVSRQLMFGLGDQPLVHTASDIRPNFRGEYRAEPFCDPLLYLSPVDHKFHLLGADMGVWNQGRGWRIRYNDLNHDSYIDQWQLTFADEEQESPEETIRSLQIAGDLLVYGDEERVRLVRTAIDPPPFTAPPPRDHEEWMTMGEQLEMYQAGWAPDDFSSMIDQFRGPTTEIPGATLEDFRLTDAGFRFVLHLSPSFRVPWDANDLGAADLTPGAYVVTYDGAFHAQPLTPPRVILEGGTITSDPPQPRHMEWVSLQAVFRNTGLQDAALIPLRIYVAQEGEERQILAVQPISVLGEESFILNQTWLAQEPGRWRVWFEIDAEAVEPPETEIVALEPLRVEVEPVGLPAMFDPLGPYDGMRITWPVTLLLGAVGLACTSIFSLILLQEREVGT